jgi:hypothetical protein
MPHPRYLEHRDGCEWVSTGFCNCGAIAYARSKEELQMLELRTRHPTLTRLADTMNDRPRPAGPNLARLHNWAVHRDLQLEWTTGSQMDPEMSVTLLDSETNIPAARRTILQETSRDSIDTAALYMIGRLHLLGIDMNDTGPTPSEHADMQDALLDVAAAFQAFDNNAIGCDESATLAAIRTALEDVWPS